MEAVGVGILGFAHGHANAYCARWRAAPSLGVRVLTGWDHDAARAQQACANHGIEPATSAQDLLARTDVGAVVIAAETSAHAELVEQAAAAGKAIILQKPIAVTMEQADRVVAAVRCAGVPFTMAWQMRVDPHNLQVKSLLQSGQLGRVFMLRRRHCLPTQLWKDFDKSWHVQPSLNRDIFADDACHAIDFIYWLLGMPTSVVAEMGTLLNPAVPNDTAIAVFRYKDAAFAEVSCSFVALAGENTLEVVCERGVIVGNYGDVPSTSVARLPGSVQLKWYVEGTGAWAVSNIPDVMQQSERIAGLAAPLADFLHGKRPAIATAEEGRTVLQLVLACYESATKGRRIVLGPRREGTA
jgi:predicted dehydrogenase